MYSNALSIAEVFMRQFFSEHYPAFYALLAFKKKEASLSKRELPWAAGMILLDAAAPILLMYGLETCSAANASLLFNFEMVATTLIAFAFILMMSGVYLIMKEDHLHTYTHEVIVHDHAHLHNDKHHSHQHDFIVNGWHSHIHTHAACTHDHPHTPDLHHKHLL